MCPCLHLGFFMPHLRESIFIFVFIFIMINCIISWIQTCLFFCLFFRICPVIVRWSCGWIMPIVFGCQKFSLRVFLSICLIFANSSLVLLIEVLLVRKKPCSEAYSRKASLMLRVNHNTSIQIKLLILPLKKIVEKIVNYSLPPRRNPPLDTLDTWISDTSDPTDLNTKKAICFVPFNHLAHDPLDQG